jgi:hypothetical protein
MCALSANRDTREIVGALVSLTVKAAKTIYAGALVAVDATGYAVPASDTAGLKVLGRAEHGAAAGETVLVKRGTFLFGNKSGDLLTSARIGGYCYVTDDETVQHTANSNAVIAGVVRGVVTDGVYVDTAWYVDGAAAAAAGETAGETAGATAGAEAIAADLADGSSTIKAAALVQGAAAVAADLAAAESTIKAAALVQGATASAADLAAAESTIKAAALVQGAAAVAADLAAAESTIKAAATTIAGNAIAAAGNVRLVTAPATADAAGVKGDIAIDEGAIYLCTATGTWVKATLVFATWGA